MEKKLGRPLKTINGIAMHPAWKNALSLFNNEKFAYGDTIPYAWFYEAFDINMPTSTTSTEIADEDRLKFFSSIEALKKALLKEQSIALKNVRREGYKIVHPKDQTKWAEQDGMQTIGKAVDLMLQRETHVNYRVLTFEERRENADAIARAAMLKGMVGTVEKKMIQSENQLRLEAE